jgi:hypothetical protein
MTRTAPVAAPAGTAAAVTATAAVAAGPGRRQTHSGQLDPIVAGLQQLADLKERGLLTDAEFASQKTRLLSQQTQGKT